MDNLKEQLETAMAKNHKNRSVELVSDALENGLSPLELYESVITPIMHGIDCDSNDYDCIWHEHQMTSIARTLIEMAYPYVIKQKTRSFDKHVLVACPKDEYHELGAIIGTHMLSFYGFETTYTGADTPQETLLSALKNLKVDYLVVSVSNVYHLFEVNRMLKAVSDAYPDVTLIGAGRGFETHKSQVKDKVRYIITDKASIETLLEVEGLE